MLKIEKITQSTSLGLVTKDDTTNEFAELCKTLQINPAVTKYRNQGSGKKARSSAKPRYGGGGGGPGENADSEFKEPKPPAAESHQSKKSKHEETSGVPTDAVIYLSTNVFIPCS